jgi:hypothetical protein
MMDLISTYIKDRIKLKLGLYPKVRDQDVEKILGNAYKIIDILKRNDIRNEEKWSYMLFEMSYLYAFNKKLWSDIVIVSRDWGKMMHKRVMNNE